MSELIPVYSEEQDAAAQATAMLSEAEIAAMQDDLPACADGLAGFRAAAEIHDATRRRSWLQHDGLAIRLARAYRPPAR